MIAFFNAIKNLVYIVYHNDPPNLPTHPFCNVATSERFHPIAQSRTIYPTTKYTGK